MENRKHKEKETDMETRLVKVYGRPKNGKWVDRGTGSITVDVLEKSDSLALFVSDEDNNDTILLHHISPDDIYQKQEDTIISWRDSSYSVELSLSFQETSVRSFIWDHICNVQRSKHFDTPSEDIFVHQSALGELPSMTMSTLPLILKIVLKSDINDRVHLTELILHDKEFFEKLMDLFRTCEGLENLDGLRMIYKIVKGIIRLNSLQIFKKIFRDEFILDIIGCFEYDPEVSHVRHRGFLKEIVVFKEAMPIKDPMILSKIHQTYRIGYLKDMFLSRADEGTIAILNSIIHANNVFIIDSLKKDITFIQELFSRLRSSSTSVESRKNLVNFLLEFCTLSKSLQKAQQHWFFRDLVNEGLFDIISNFLRSEDKHLVLTGTNILILSTVQNPNLLRSVVVKPEGTQLLGQLIHGLLTDFGDDMHTQFFEIVKNLLDSTTLAGPHSKRFIKILCERHMGPLVDVIALSCLEASDNLAKPDVGDSVKHSKTSPEILLHISDLLYFCVSHHPYQIKSYILLHNMDMMDKVLLLTRRKEKYMVLAAVRFIRSLISLNDQRIINYIAERELLIFIVHAFVANGDCDNMLKSAVLELFEFIQKENLKPLLNYLVESCWGQLCEFEILPSVHSIKVKYEQNSNTKPQVIASPESSGTKSSVCMDSGKHVDDRALEKKEDYFNDHSDEEDSQSPSSSEDDEEDSQSPSSSEVDEEDAQSAFSPDVHPTSSSGPTLTPRGSTLRLELEDYDNLNDDDGDKDYKLSPTKRMKMHGCCLYRSS